MGTHDSDPLAASPQGTKTAVLGFGRFGRTLTDLILDSGRPVSVIDPGVEIPSELRSDSHRELVEGAGEIFIAVDVPSIETALGAVRPFLEPWQIVIDVASVKLGPIQVMKEVLGERIPWVGTHPLFGPASISRWRRRLQVLVCPNPMHSDAASRAGSFYRRLGCEVFEQGEDEHDRLMARTHALAFFLAKGLLEIGVDDRIPFAPPSFQALAEAIDSVRADAGHLYLAIETANPYAEESRQGLLDALSRLHAELADVTLETDASAATFAVPDLGDRAPELLETRDLIDDLDLQLVNLLARRAQLAHRAGRIKAEEGQRVRDVSREREMLTERRRWAADQDLDAEAVARVFEAVLSFSRGVQRDR